MDFSGQTSVLLSLQLFEVLSFPDVIRFKHDSFLAGCL